MEIEVNWDNVTEVERNIEGDEIYSISFSFNNGEVATYGYTDFKKFMRDSTKISERIGK